MSKYTRQTHLTACLCWCDERLNHVTPACSVLSHLLMPLFILSESQQHPPLLLIDKWILTASTLIHVCRPDWSAENQFCSVCTCLAAVAVENKTNMRVKSCLEHLLSTFLVFSSDVKSFMYSISISVYVYDAHTAHGYENCLEQSQLQQDETDHFSILMKCWYALSCGQ